MRHKVLAVLLSAAVALSLAGCASMGVIGGEDGPTEIFITGPGAQRPGESGQIPSPDGGVPAPAEDPAVPAPDSDGYTGEEDGPLYETGLEEEAAPDEEGTYNSAEDVALYLACYGRLPDNYITKEEARDPKGGAITSATSIPLAAAAGARSGWCSLTTASSTTQRTTMRAFRFSMGRSNGDGNHCHRRGGPRLPRRCPRLPLRPPGPAGLLRAKPGRAL